VCHRCRSSDRAIQLVIGGTGRDPVCIGVAVQVAIGV